MLCCSAGAWATEIDELSADQVSVRELMRLETEQALRRLRTGERAPASGNGLHGSAQIAAVGAAARLVAIYGVGSKLMAEVQVDGRRLLFIRGRPEAVGPGRTHAMRLLGITERCIEVSVNEQREFLCAPMPGAGEG
ncbi:MAG TPA: hypothetical protein VL003_01120 [Pusillimonas sp.]|uniref:hypothetical protein n=1 Tax=Pusillimonas sp. TaxID=3040095 RepID=UPI002B59801D|nr:hypothetical protein [Pusillimonas sp.]HUH86637.1 hypothetical protein [Pusillimonas sp.]